MCQFNGDLGDIFHETKIRILTNEVQVVTGSKGNQSEKRQLHDESSKSSFQWNAKLKLVIQLKLRALYSPDFRDKN